MIPVTIGLTKLQKAPLNTGFQKKKLNIPNFEKDGMEWQSRGVQDFGLQLAAFPQQHC